MPFAFSAHGSTQELPPTETSTHPVPQFMASEENRARYWARSFAGWHKFSGVRPNAAHDGIARLQQSGARPGGLRSVLVLPACAEDSCCMRIAVALQDSAGGMSVVVCRLRAACQVGHMPPCHPATGHGVQPCPTSQPPLCLQAGGRRSSLRTWTACTKRPALSLCWSCMAPHTRWSAWTVVG